MIDIIIENEQAKEEVTEEVTEAINNVCEAVLKEEACDFDAQISITLVDNESIREINKEQRDIDRATDVLSFPMLEFDEEGNLLFKSSADEGDLLYDEIACGMLVKKYQYEKRELLESLEMFFKVFFLGME